MTQEFISEITVLPPDSTLGFERLVVQGKI